MSKSVYCQVLTAAIAATIVTACSSGSPSFNSFAPTGSAASRRQLNSADCPAYSGGTGILPDGDFSQGPEPPASDGDSVYFKGQVFAPSWKVTKNSIDFVGSTYWDIGGVCSVDLDGQEDSNPVGGIKSAAFPTLKKKSYTVTFLLSGNGHCAPAVKTADVSADGQTPNMANINKNSGSLQPRFDDPTHVQQSRPETKRLWRGHRRHVRDGRLAGTSMKFGLD
jgi:Protein of unknown function (DUF642)